MLPRKGVFSHVINECTTICYEKIQNMSRASKNCLLAKKILYPTKKKNVLESAKSHIETLLPQ